jgi:hypothetical protein
MTDTTDKQPGREEGQGESLVIAGSRSIDPRAAYDAIESALAATDYTIREIVSGTARGVDAAGELWAHRHNFPVRRFPADWKTFGKRAGVMRNVDMARHADRLLAIWDGESRGTGHMVSAMRALGKPVQIAKVGVTKPEAPESHTKVITANGIKIRVTRDDKKKSTIRLQTNYAMEDKTRFSIMAELKQSAIRSRTTPELTTHGGFCTHIRSDMAVLTAQRILGIARRDIVSAAIDKIVIKPNCTRRKKSGRKRPAVVNELPS